MITQYPEVVYTSRMSDEIPRINTEKSPLTEKEAAEILHDQELSPAEQERLVQMLINPELSMYVVGDDPYGKKLNERQAEKLFTQVLADREVVEVFYINLTESGVELSDIEKSWLKRLEEVRSQY